MAHIVVVVAHRPVVVELLGVGGKLVLDLVEPVLVRVVDDIRPMRDCPRNAGHCIVDHMNRRRIVRHHRYRSCFLSTLVELVRPKVHVVVLVGLRANDRQKLGNCKSIFKWKEEKYMFNNVE